MCFIQEKVQNLEFVQRDVSLEEIEPKPAQKVSLKIEFLILRIGLIGLS